MLRLVDEIHVVRQLVIRSIPQLVHNSLFVEVKVHLIPYLFTI